MPILKNWFGRITDAVQQTFQSKQEKQREAAGEIQRLLMQAVVARQPIGLPDSWDVSTTSSMRQKHTTIRDGWGLGEIVFRDPDTIGISLSNVSEHIKYFVWSVGGVRRSHLGTEQHFIPGEGEYATEVYGHPLAFFWQKKGRPHVRHSWVDHPGMPELRGQQQDFIQLAWQDIEPNAQEIWRRATRGVLDPVRRIFS